MKVFSVSDGRAVLRPWQPVRQAMATTDRQLYPHGRRGGGRGGSDGGHVTEPSKQTCAEEEKRKRLWQNILKALLGGDWLIGLVPAGHRQQVHVIHLV